MKKFVLSEEARMEIKKACKRLDEEEKNKKNVYEEDYFEKLDRMDLGELADELIRLMKESGEEVNINEVSRFDRAATSEEIAEEGRKKNSYFNY